MKFVAITLFFIGMLLLVTYSRIERENSALVKSGHIVGKCFEYPDKYTMEIRGVANNGERRTNSFAVTKKLFNSVELGQYFYR